jgi:hypothetical protein
MYDAHLHLHVYDTDTDNNVIECNIIYVEVVSVLTPLCVGVDT